MKTRQVKDIFKYAREHYLKINQRDMSKLLGKGQSVYAKYETGDVNPPSALMILLMNHLMAEFGQNMLDDLLFHQTAEISIDSDILQLQTTLLKFAGNEHKQAREHIKYMLNNLAGE